MHRDDDNDDDAVDEFDEDDVQLEHPKNDGRCVAAPATWSSLFVFCPSFLC